MGGRCSCNSTANRGDRGSRRRGATSKQPSPPHLTFRAAHRRALHCLRQHAAGGDLQKQLALASARGPSNLQHVPRPEPQVLRSACFWY